MRRLTKSRDGQILDVAARLAVPVVRRWLGHSPIATDDRKQEYHAQLAYAQIDLTPPALDDAIVHLNQAIQLRGESIRETHGNMNCIERSPKF